MVLHKSKKIEVCAHWEGMPKPLLIGHLFANPARRKEIFAFEYDPDWLKNKNHLLDPALHLYEGIHYAPTQQTNFGIFLDSSPDRWGRFLMQRREAQFAREEKREPHQLIESDFLLGVYDANRIGGLRFRLSPDQPFLDDNKTFASPPWTSLRELEYASLEIERKNAEKNPNYAKWLKMLIAPGGSLGGARPKASIIDESNHLWIAKFPSANDEWDIGGWEMTVANLAKRAKIIVADTKVKKFNSKHHTFLNKRFDRNSLGERIHFASAMTLLQRIDGDDESNGASYLELAEIILRQGAKPDQDLEQLWRRIVFSICVSNVDDHLRNHGFLFTNDGWVLSPAYDINPIPTGDGLRLNISESDNSQDLELAKEVALFFRLKLKEANTIIHEIKDTVRNWHQEASSIGLSLDEQDKMKNAFRIAYL